MARRGCTAAWAPKVEGVAPTFGGINLEDIKAPECFYLEPELQSVDEGEEQGKFIAPHGMAVDSKGDIYVGEVSFTIRGSRMDPPKELRSLTKLVKVN